MTAAASTAYSNQCHYHQTQLAEVRRQSDFRFSNYYYFQLQRAHGIGILANNSRLSNIIQKAIAPQASNFSTSANNNNTNSTMPDDDEKEDDEALGITQNIQQAVAAITHLNNELRTTVNLFHMLKAIL